jgi:hypothetical protein
MPSACFAMTGSEVVNAINSAHILDPGVGVNARVDNDKVTISTYRNPKNNERDCKIDAIEIAKTVCDASKDSIVRITVCFYGKDLSQYQEVSVTAGDLKSFATGATGQEQLLSSIEVHSRKVSSGADKVDNDLASTAFGGTNYKVTQTRDDEVVISTPMGPWVTDEECKLDALKIASVVANDLPDGVQKITVAFFDPANRAETRLVTFVASGLIDAWKTVQQALSIFPMNKQAPTADLQSMQASPGVDKAERDELLQRIKALQSQGIGMAPFVKYFQQIEQLARSGDEAGVKAAVSHLNNSLDEQAKASKSAKDADSKHTAQSGTAKSGFSGEAIQVRGSWDAFGTKPVIAEQVLADPQGYLKHNMRVVAPAKQAVLLDYVVRLLNANGKGDVAATLQKGGVAPWMK